MIGKFFDRLFYYIYPARCAFCGELMPYSQTGVYICPLCMERVTFCTPSTSCSLCGAFFDSSPKEGKPKRALCPECFSLRRKGGKRAFDKIVAACLYDEFSREGILKFKRGANLGAADTFGNITAAGIRGRCPGTEFDFVTAVPPRKARLREIGFDQCDILAMKTAKALGVPYIKNAMKRVKETGKQTELSQEERRSNLRGTFALGIDPRKIRGKSLLVIDDVKTTGSTLEECASVLKEKGAAYVCGATIAATAAEGAG